VSAMSPSLTQGEIFQCVTLVLTALVGAVFGGHAGWVNAKRSYVRMGWLLICLPLGTYICGSLVSVFIPDHQPTSSFAVGSIALWYLFALPLVGVSAAFAWALVWLACCLHRIVRDRNS